MAFFSFLLSSLLNLVMKSLLGFVLRSLIHFVLRSLLRFVLRSLLDFRNPAKLLVVCHIGHSGGSYEEGPVILVGLHIFTVVVLVFGTLATVVALTKRALLFSLACTSSQ